MDVVSSEIKTLSAQLTSNKWKFNPTYKQECRTLLKQATSLCANDSWISKLDSSLSESDSSEWWRLGICNGFAIVLVRVYTLLQDCRYCQQPTFEYSARDFWSLWLELSWYNKLVVSSSSQVSEINRLDTICLQDDMYTVLQTHDSEDHRIRTRQLCEITGEGMCSFKRVIREGNRQQSIGLVREVTLKGLEDHTFAGKCIDPNALHEIDIHLAVDHPNVARVKGWCQTGVMTPYLVIELMDCDLRKWINNQHPLHGVQEGSSFKKESMFYWQYMVVAIDILYQIAQGMRYVQKCNVAHRDLKTDNILLREELYDGRRVSYFMTAKLTDFGTSKQKDDGLFTTEKVGTRTYRAPEVMKAEEWGNYSPRADVWSFGVLAWEVLTGQEPTTEDGKPQKWPKQRGWIHPYLVGCIQSCWEMRPSKRPSFESICVVMQHLKKSMFRNKGIYHTSAVTLAGKSPVELAKQYQIHQKDLDKWWMIVLVNDLQPSKPLLRFNPQGCDPRKVNQVLDGIFGGSLSPHSFLFCRCFLQKHMQPFNSSLSSSSRSSSANNSTESLPHSVNGVNGSFSGRSLYDSDPVVQELCSQAALQKAKSMACSFVKDTVDSSAKELSNSIHLLFRQLEARLHQRQYSW
eukprot:c5204_g1_i1 orf=141-2033(+)